MFTVYLTFDDGPRPGTDDVISVLNSEQVPGTLFMIGGQAGSAWSKAQLDAAQCSRFVEIGNHSMNHANSQYSSYYSNPQGVLADFKSANKPLRLTGKPIPARFPGRCTWKLPTRTLIDRDNGGDTAAAADLLYNDGFRIYGWDVEWKMSKDGQATHSPLWAFGQIELACLLGTFGLGEVVLLTHDVMFKQSTGGRANLVQLINMLRKANFSFDFISNFRGENRWQSYRPMPLAS